jgi:RHS repeat-associated protein
MVAFANEIEGITGGSVTPLYDLAGNMIFGPKTGDETTGVHYIYDAWNRLTEVYQDDGDGVFEPGTQDTLVVRYTYDGLNRRIEKLFDEYGLGDQYYYNTDWQIIEDRYMYDWLSPEWIDSYIWNPDYIDSPMVCLHDGNASGDVLDDYPTDWRRYYLTDANHNVTTTIRYDNYNDIAYDGISRNVYTPYGEVTRLGEDWSGSSVEGFFDSPLYAGYFFDVETSLYQARNRYYDSGLAIWIGRDPIESTPNLYAYCGGNPTNATDPSGLREERLSDTRRTELLGIAERELRELMNAGTITRDEARLRWAVVKYALSSPFKFSSGGWRNPEYWTDSIDPEGQYTVRADRKPSDAIKDVWATPGYRTGCKKACETIILRGVIHLIGIWDSKDGSTKYLDRFNKLIGTKVPSAVMGAFMTSE